MSDLRVNQTPISNKQINHPSDGPSDAVAALRYRSDITRNSQYSRNANDALAYLVTVDTTLASMLNDLRRVRDVVVQDANGTLSPTDRQALAAEVDNIRAGLLAQANTQYVGRPVFGGTTASPTAYDPTTGAYAGDAGTVSRNLAPNSPALPLSLSGPTIFGPAGTSLFDVLGNISRRLKNGTSADVAALSNADLFSLDAATNTISTALSTIHARSNRAESAKHNADRVLVTLKDGLSQVEDADLPKTITELHLQQTAYQAALAATARVIQPSLVDFLK